MRDIFGITGIDSYLFENTSNIAIHGSTDCGKTSLCLQAIQNFTRNKNDRVLFVDTENSLNIDMLNWSNIDLSKLTIAKQNAEKSGIELALDHLRNNNQIKLVVIDCMTALTKDDIALHNLVRTQFPELARFTRAKSLPLIVTLQERYLNNLRSPSGGTENIFRSYMDAVIFLQTDGYNLYGGKRIALKVKYTLQSRLERDIRNTTGKIVIDFRSGIRELRKFILQNEINKTEIEIYSD